MLVLIAIAFAQIGLPLTVRDAFDRPINESGITLLDWEGEIGNPAIQIKIEPPKTVTYPVHIYLHSTCSRIYFNRSDGSDRYGVGKDIYLASEPKSTTPVWIAIFPDRDGKDEDHKLVLQVFDASNAEKVRSYVPIHVIDQDKDESRVSYIKLDYSQDTTDFTLSDDVRRVVGQAAADWSYFIDDMNLDEVKAASEQTEVWNKDGFVASRLVKNKTSYTGYLMYIVGIHGTELRSGGASSWSGGQQHSGGKELPLKRSGVVHFDTAGNYHELGWFYSRGDDDWWVSGSQRNEPADFYSIAVHEMGHALCFFEAYPISRTAKTTKKYSAVEVRDYLGFDPGYDASDHLIGATDPASKMGGFGLEYHGEMKTRRWLITKLHLLCLKANGYKIRSVSCFDPLVAALPESVAAKLGAPVQIVPQAYGGIPAYFWRIKEGALPKGVGISSITGAITGSPTELGDFPITMEVKDQSPKPYVKEVRFVFRVAKGP
jgi:hypothetical protein